MKGTVRGVLSLRVVDGNVQKLWHVIDPEQDGIEVITNPGSDVAQIRYDLLKQDLELFEAHLRGSPIIQILSNIPEPVPPEEIEDDFDDYDQMGHMGQPPPQKYPHQQRVQPPNPGYYNPNEYQDLQPQLRGPKPPHYAPYEQHDQQRPLPQYNQKLNHSQTFKQPPPQQLNQPPAPNMPPYKPSMPQQGFEQPAYPPQGQTQGQFKQHQPHQQPYPQRKPQPHEQHDSQIYQKDPMYENYSDYRQPPPPPQHHHHQPAPHHQPMHNQQHYPRNQHQQWTQPEEYPQNKKYAQPPQQGYNKQKDFQKGGFKDRASQESPYEDYESYPSQGTYDKYPPQQQYDRSRQNPHKQQPPAQPQPLPQPRPKQHQNPYPQPQPAPQPRSKHNQSQHSQQHSSQHSQQPLPQPQPSKPAPPQPKRKPEDPSAPVATPSITAFISTPNEKFIDDTVENINKKPGFNRSKKKSNNRQRKLEEYILSHAKMSDTQQEETGHSQLGSEVETRKISSGVMKRDSGSGESQKRKDPRRVPKLEFKPEADYSDSDDSNFPPIGDSFKGSSDEEDEDNSVKLLSSSGVISGSVEISKGKISPRRVKNSRSPSKKQDHINIEENTPADNKVEHSGLVFEGQDFEDDGGIPFESFSPAK
jgi:hypothetical protein